ncbi:S-layer homology domain-containing protein [Lacrimispora sp.]|uniref:S-layer homology domain-containing protein n=1 Tax=Lacrimispora sp. TaxID=2719234 RepID=UPI00399364E8
MSRKKQSYRYIGGIVAATTVITQFQPVIASADISTSDFNMRDNVVSLTGIMEVSNNMGQVTRGDFARMLVNASGFRENLPASSSSVFADVPVDNPNAVFIKIAVSQGFMTGFLGGVFRPDEKVTYREGVKAVLALLGYGDGDFTGDMTSSRMSRFQFLELNENLNRGADEVLNQSDCVNLFYNLLKTKKKDTSEIYGKMLDCELNSDGEINPISILKDERKGPILVRKGFSVSQSVPFSSEKANVFLNGTASTLAAVKASQKATGFVVLYYNVKSKTIWAYTTDGWDNDTLTGENAYVLLMGEVKNIYYKSTDVITPTSIRLEVDTGNSDSEISDSEAMDDNGYLSVNLDSSKLQYLFSIYGKVTVGDKVVIVCSKNGTAYTAVDAIDY